MSRHRRRNTPIRELEKLTMRREYAPPASAESAACSMYPKLVAEALQLKAVTAVIDGEIVALDESGLPSFQALQHRSSHPQAQIVFFAFDLLHLDGRALLTESLTKRRKRLYGIVGATGLVRRLEELTGSAPRVVQAVTDRPNPSVSRSRPQAPTTAGEVLVIPGADFYVGAHS